MGGDGNDTIIGGRGSDTLVGGPGNDTFVWNPGDGSDVIEGQGGHDVLQFNGSNANENINLSANGSRLRLSRDVGNVTMDVNGVEQVNVVALGGADAVTVNNLSGTGVTGVNSSTCASAPGSGRGDGQLDTVVVNGTAHADAIQNNRQRDQSLHRGRTVGHSDGPRAPKGPTTPSSSTPSAATTPSTAAGLQAGVVSLTVDGGTGNDMITGEATATTR